ncbi:MAG: hypothetical protein KGJ35_02925 [Patescibacteria group bacterium]|nr:hypothetical protein [Patescibacteria group bacterium]
MLEIRPTLTPAGMARRKLKNWWIGLHGHFKDYCGIYNSGKHLYVSTHPPGTFIAPPIVLTFFPFRETIVTVGQLLILHRGHAYGKNGGTARISVQVMGFDERFEIDIHATNMAYIIRNREQVLCEQAMLMLPSYVLGKT